MTDKATHPILSQVRQGLIVSCQASEGGPLNRPEIMAAMAEAAVIGGAVAIRADHPENIRAIRQEVPVPIIGIFKKKYPDAPVFITPTIKEALAVAEAGADIIALDATHRPRPGGQTLQEIIGYLRQKTGALLMADVATLEEGLQAAAMGFDLIATTLSGYTETTRHLINKSPDFVLLSALKKHLPNVPIVAEGRIWHPEEARQALQRGAFAVVVGTAITRPADITRRFARALQSFQCLSERWVLGIDLGGTKTAVGLVNGRGEIRQKQIFSTPWHKGIAKVVRKLVDSIQQFRDKGADAIEIIGLAVSGRVEVEKGQVFAGVPLSEDYLDYPIADALRQATGLAVYMENDANAAAYGEYRFLADPASVARMVMVTLGTGIGGGIVLHGKLYRGRGNAGEFGHICIEAGGRSCPCGRQGCLEQYVSRQRLQEAIEEHIARGQISGKGLQLPLDTDRIIQLIQERHPKVLNIFHQQMDYLAAGLESLINTLDPQLIILGGEIARLGTDLIHPLQTRLKNAPPMQIACLGNDAGMIGAALLAFERHPISSED